MCKPRNDQFWKLNYIGRPMLSPLEIVMVKKNHVTYTKLTFEIISQYRSWEVQK